MSFAATAKFFVFCRPDLEFSPKGMKFQSHVQFVKLADDSNVIKCLEEKGKCE